MKYSSFYKRTVLAVVVSLGAQPLVMAMDTPVSPVFEVFRSKLAIASVVPAELVAPAASAALVAPVASVTSATVTATSSIMSKAGWGVWKILKSPTVAFMSRISDKADLLAENHPVICAALVAGGCYGIYSLYKYLRSGGFRRVWRRRGRSDEEVLVED